MENHDEVQANGKRAQAKDLDRYNIRSVLTATGRAGYVIRAAAILLTLLSVAPAAQATLYHDCNWSQYWQQIHAAETEDWQGGCTNHDYEVDQYISGEGRCTIGNKVRPGDDDTNFTWVTHVACSAGDCTVWGKLFCPHAYVTYQEYTLTCDGTGPGNPPRARGNFNYADCIDIGSDGIAHRCVCGMVGADCY